jgi:putative Mn2+ efflux pump MntP
MRDQVLLAKDKLPDWEKLPTVAIATSLNTVVKNFSQDIRPINVSTTSITVHKVRFIISIYGFRTLDLSTQATENVLRSAQNSALC